MPMKSCSEFGPSLNPAATEVIGNETVDDRRRRRGGGSHPGTGTTSVEMRTLLSRLIEIWLLLSGNRLRERWKSLSRKYVKIRR